MILLGYKCKMKIGKNRPNEDYLSIRSQGWNIYYLNYELEE